MTQEPLNFASTRGALDDVLNEQPDVVSDRVARSIRALIGSGEPSFVLFGAGPLGRNALAGLRKAGVEPLAFADNNRRLWGETVNGVQVLSPTQAVDSYGDRAVFVATVYTHHGLGEQLRGLNVPHISFPALAWLYPALMPHYALDYPHAMFKESESVRKAFALWSDDASRREFLGQIRWRTSLNDQILPPYLPPEQTYFPEDLFHWSSNEVLVDCGAFDGDTVRDVVRRHGSAFGKIIALEPDRANLERLQQFLATLPVELRIKVDVLHVAAGSSDKSVALDATGTGSSAVGVGNVEIASAPLDELVQEYAPTFVKMDIEGSEGDALAGARRVIQRHAPILAICLYHRPTDLWEIPLQVRAMTDRYNFYLRRYSNDCWEQILYAIPKERVLQRE